MMALVNWLHQLDQSLFLLLNGLGQPWLNAPMLWLSDKYLWIPLYLFLIFRMWQQDKQKMYLALLAILLTITITDQLTANVLKPLVGRLRPCKDPDLVHLVELVGTCRGTFGFASGHAANTFGLASFFFFRERSRLGVGLLVWAALVSYSRVYLGVHYPGDILVGALIGMGCGYAGASGLSFWRKRG